LGLPTRSQRHDTARAQDQELLRADGLGVAQQFCAGVRGLVGHPESVGGYATALQERADTREVPP
jgi:hypothetical protein